KVPAFACAGMAGMSGAVVYDFEPCGRELLFQCRADAADAFGCHVRQACAEGGCGCCRMIQKNCANVKAKSTAMKTNLDFTHVASLRLNAMTRLATPSTA